MSRILAISRPYASTSRPGDTGDVPGLAAALTMTCRWHPRREAVNRYGTLPGWPGRSPRQPRARTFIGRRGERTNMVAPRVGDAAVGYLELNAEFEAASYHAIGCGSDPNDTPRAKRHSPLRTP